MTGRLKGAAASCARRSASRSLAPATLFDRRALTPTTTSRLRSIAPRASARDVDQAAADLRRAAHHRGDRVHVVGSARAGIDEAGHTVLQAHRRSLLAAAGMDVDVNQARSDDLAARI